MRYVGFKTQPDSKIKILAIISNNHCKPWLWSQYFKISNLWLNSCSDFDPIMIMLLCDVKFWKVKIKKKKKNSKIKIKSEFFYILIHPLIHFIKLSDRSSHHSFPIPSFCYSSIYFRYYAFKDIIILFLSSCLLCNVKYVKLSIDLGRVSTFN